MIFLRWFFSGKWSPADKIHDLYRDVTDDGTMLYVYNYPNIGFIEHRLRKAGVECWGCERGEEGNYAVVSISKRDFKKAIKVLGPSNVQIPG